MSELLQTPTATLSIGTRSAILLLAWVHGVFAALFLVRRAARRRIVADVYLALLLLACCGELTSHLIGWAGAYDRWPSLSFFPFSSAFAVGPLVWLHVQSLTVGGFRPRRGHLWHAVPTMLEVSWYLWAWSHPLPWKNAFDDAVNVPYVVPLRAMLSGGQTCIYLVLAGRQFACYRAWVDGTQSDAGLRLEWLERLLWVAMVGLAVECAFHIVNVFVPLGFRGWFVYEVLVALLTYYLAVVGTITVPDPAPPDTMPGVPRVVEAAPPAADVSDRLGHWLERLEQVMRDAEPWRDAELSLSTLANLLHSNPSTISAVINGGKGQNFNDYINGYRVRAVQSRLAGGRASTESLLALAFSCGFNSKSTFNRAFRKHAGVSPSDFIRTLASRHPDSGAESS